MQSENAADLPERTDAKVLFQERTSVPDSRLRRLSPLLLGFLPVWIVCFITSLCCNFWGNIFFLDAFLFLLFFVGPLMLLGISAYSYDLQN